MDKKELVSAALWLCAALAVMAASLHLGLGVLRHPGPGFLAFWSALLLALLSGVHTWRHRRAREKERPPAGAWVNPPGPAAAWTTAVLILYALALPQLGYLSATFGLMVALFSMGKLKLRTAVSGAVLASVLTFILFDLFLRVPFPRGLFAF
ncbi:MAG: tripartite tricarboxylate transporter TctB family protein [Syntrophales bacterium]|jgi:uncharacterized iron-regulated membrane protein|nr:tripartite tricarboxylate transporter TctB family protein [Syntrophales bacterium]